MSKAIRSYPKDEQEKVATRRIKEDAGGLGTLSAIGYFLWKKTSEKKQEKIDKALEDLRKLEKKYQYPNLEEEKFLNSVDEADNYRASLGEI